MYITSKVIQHVMLHNSSGYTHSYLCETFLAATFRLHDQDLSS